MSTGIERGREVVATEDALSIFRIASVKKGHSYVVADIGSFGQIQPVVYLEGFPPDVYFHREFFRPITVKPS